MINKAQELFSSREKINIILFENETNRKDTWLENLGISSQEFDILIDAGIFRKIGVKRKKIKEYSLLLVGIAFLSEKNIISLPKVYLGQSITEKEAIQNLEEVIKVIQLYKLRVKSLSSSSLYLSEMDFNGYKNKNISIFKSLLSWTDKYGFHQEHNDENVGSNGSIDWPKTIRTSVALHGKTFTVYDNPIQKRRKLISGSLRPFQLLAITSLAEDLRPISDIIAGPLNYYIDEAIEIYKIEEQPSFKNNHQILSGLQNILLETNKDHEHDLARNLISYFSSNPILSKPSTKIFGTNAFHAIWESICKDIINNIGHTGDFQKKSSNLTHQDGSTSTNWLQPDHFITLRSSEKNMLFDSKWHHAEKKFSSGDIVKQFMYELTLHENLHANALLSPTNNSSVTSFGEIFLEKNKTIDTRFNPIKVIGIPWKSAIDSYLHQNGESLSQAIVELAKR
jgi:hypothetical protein